MARPGISKLGLPPKKYRPDRRATRKDGLIKFETEEASYTEDEFRIGQLRRVARLYPSLFKKNYIRQLRRRLRKGVEGHRPDRTPASSIYMRNWRVRVVGWLWQLYADPRSAPVTTAHILPTKWILTPDELMRVSSKKLMKRLRSDLNRLGAKKADGFFFAFLHGEYNLDDGCFHLHVHCLVSKGMIAVVKRLKTVERARLRKTTNSVKRSPVLIRKKPLKNLPGPFSYCCQSYWPRKGYHDGVTGDWKRGKKHRIPEPYHTMFLLWIDQWKLEDLALMMKLSVRAGKMKVCR
ncbi:MULTISPECIES: hypothetical protein [Sphingobium]|uniref:hypothetical protein n=1 Tax=Sphingobium TaxID=165695 RepID=UPI0011AE483A|nr:MULTISPECIES: hypothetical protein [Sphingobium]KAA9013046.1 hypothetical protein F4U94_17255 [Sphingobium limneticum]